MSRHWNTGTVNGMARWPRRLTNFPIILVAITQQYIWATAIWYDKEALNTTGTHILGLIMPADVLIGVLLFVTTLSLIGFFAKKRLVTCLALLPQQGMLFLSSAGAFISIWHGRFADGVERSSAFLLVDQCPILLIAFFHSWAIFIIYRYTADRR